MGNIHGVNSVDQEGRYKLPPPLDERFKGQHLAAYVNGSGNIELKPVPREE